MSITTSTSSLGLSLVLASLERTYNVDLLLNVYRRHESILYQSSDTSAAVNVAYFASKPLLSTNVLHIRDRSNSLIANRIEQLDTPANIESLSEYEVPTDKFIVTDVYVAEDNSNQSTALFYQHVISTDNLPRGTDYEILTGYTLTDVEVLDINFDPLTIDSVKIDWDEGLIFNNLSSSFDQETGAATVYYIRYSVKNPSNVINSYVELLSNVPIFVAADFDDLDENLEIIDDGRRVYLVEEQEDSFLVKLPHIGNYSFQLLTDARIRLIPPPPSDVDDTWNVSVSNGKVFTVLDGVTYKYSIAEYFNQRWNPDIPYKRVITEDAEFLSKNLVKLRQNNIFHNPTVSGFIDILVYESDNTPVAAFTTDSSKEGDIADNSMPFQLWSSLNREGIRSVDSKAGIVDLDGVTLKSDYKFSATYFYEESNYAFTTIDFNPVNNSDIMDQFVSFFIDPDTNLTSKSRTLYYTVSDRSGKVIKSNLSNFDNTDEKLQTDDGRWRDLYFESVPSYINSPGSILFLSHYTILGSGLFLPLGDVHISEDTHPDQATLIDTRVRGGGIKDSELEAAKTVQQEVEWYWDIGFWDGTPYPGSASYFVEVPAELLEVAGGTLKAGEIKDVVGRHTAAGVYPVVKAYGIDPVISGVIPADGQLTIKWSSYGS